MLRREPVTLVCVWNNEDVRRGCLDRSIERLLPSAPQTQYLPVDNRGQVYSTAGAALNSVVSEATNRYVAFVQQDIYLHSLVALETAAAHLADQPRFGLLGSVGITRSGEIVGRMRDRIVLVGRTASAPVEVDSVDEVLFLAPRDALLESPLSELPDLAWHAYAVEYGMRMRSRGLAVGAMDIPITHNSLSTNLARLDHAHAALARMYPEQVPTRTTCGVVVSGTPKSEGRPALLANHRWRWRWLRGSLAARRAKAATGSDKIVIADIRDHIEDVLRHVDRKPVSVVNIVTEGFTFPDPDEGTQLARGDALVRFHARTLPAFLMGPVESTALVTNLELGHLQHLRRLIRGSEHVIGYHEELGYWLIIGALAARAGEIWNSAKARPSSALMGPAFGAPSWVRRRSAMRRLPLPAGGS